MTEKFETRMVHAGRAGTKTYGYVNPKLVRGSTVLYPNMATKLALGKRVLEPVELYGICGTETHFALEAAVAEIEGGSHCQVVGSGLAAITTPLLAYLSAGDHVLMPDSVYGPTRHFCATMLKRFGIETSYYDPLIGDGIALLFRPNTRAVYCE
ncbi:MAG TPA: PLP-dependent transferase, partial [Acidocella sp.]|nr:PLP-dependent transferase [Acidocella sp.]